MPRRNTKNLVYVIILVLWGFWAFLPKLSVRTVDPPTALAGEVSGGLTLALILAFIRSVRTKIDNSSPEKKARFRGSAAALFAGIFGFSGIFVYIVAIQDLDVHQASVVSGLYPAIAIVLGVVLLKERLSRNHWIGIVLSFVAIWLVASG